MARLFAELRLGSFAGEAVMANRRICRECGSSFIARHGSREFCRASCRRAFHNRKASRGAILYDFLMAWRIDRLAFEAAGGRTLLSRMVAAFRADDSRHRAGRKSWDEPGRAKQRHPELFSAVVGVNAAGVYRPTRRGSRGRISE
jgi:ribosomal protein S27AE